QKKLAQGVIHFRNCFGVRVSGPITMGYDYVKTGLISGFGNDWLRLGAFKTQLDGSDTAPSAAMWTAYPGRGDYNGILYMTQEELDDIVLRGHEAGFQVCVHAMGTRAIEIALNSFERALNRIPKRDHRFRIEHCHFCEEKIADRIRDLGVIPVLAPGWIYWVGDSYLEKYHQEWLDWVIAARRMLDHGVKIVFHSDMPVIPSNPLPAIYSAVSRRTESGKEVGVKQRIGLKDALRAYTVNGAYANFEEKMKGSIEIGKLADLIVLSNDILRVETEEIKNLKVDLTMVDGVIRYQRVGA
ncbi:MAG: amidohydrolase family protein, partial [Candidatus Methanomethylicus sp.]|nr:amidohydrolase family protein [Candidatus Methanomethylicus sp.]